MKSLIHPAIMPHTADAVAIYAQKLEGGPEWIHIDLMDGILVPSMSWPYGDFVGSVTDVALPQTGARYELHTMTADPTPTAVELVKAGVERVIVHLEAFADPASFRACANTLRGAGACEVGLTLFLETPLERLEMFMDATDVSCIQVMSIDAVGYQGTGFNPAAHERIALLKERYPEMAISVDGGVNTTNIQTLQKSGAEAFVVGSAIIKEERPLAAFHALDELVQELRAQ